MKTAGKELSGPRAARSQPNGSGNAAVVYRLTTTRRLVPRASERRSKMIAFGYYGGKFSHLDFILPLLPTHFTHYCEVFGGSAAILINRPPAPDRKSTRLNSSHGYISYAVFCLKKK